MRAETQAVVAELERVSGLQVQIVPVHDLGVMATITASPHVTGSYVISYRPGVPFKDYLVASECSHVLRILSLPQSERFQFTTNSATANWGMELMKRFSKRSQRSVPPEPALMTFADHLVQGLLGQLRSTPIGMRVDASLAADYPSLADEQAGSLAVQQKEALSCLSPQVRAMAPDEIVSANILLNATHALFCDRLLGTTQFQVPYAASGFKDLGERLVGIFDDVPAGPSSDRALVDAWAREIGLDGKYKWVPLPPADQRAP
ncbi:MAG: hypothetical protein ACHQQS_00130 [Thermoanaerobaculales bacterium]